MPLTSLGDLAQRLVLRNESAQLKLQARTAGNEVTTGIASDIARQVGGDFGALAAIEASLSRIEARAPLNALAALRAEAQQTALGAVDAAASRLSTTLLQAVAGGGSTLAEAAATEARAAFATSFAALATRVGDRAVFAGVEVAGEALAPADTVMAALRTAVAGSTTAAEAEAAVAAWFADPAGYDAVAYRGGAPGGPVNLGAGLAADAGPTAADPAIKATLEALALAAVMADGGAPAEPSQRLELAQRAAERLTADATGRAALQGKVGIAEATIDGARIRDSAERSALQIARNDLIAVDPYEAATRFEATQTQLETLYAVTVRLSRLSLADFLR